MQIPTRPMHTVRSSCQSARCAAERARQENCSPAATSAQAVMMPRFGCHLQLTAAECKSSDYLLIGVCASQHLPRIRILGK